MGIVTFVEGGDVGLTVLGFGCVVFVADLAHGGLDGLILCVGGCDGEGDGEEECVCGCFIHD